MNESRREFFKKGLGCLGLAALATVAPQPLLAAGVKKSGKLKKRTNRVLLIALDGISVDGFKQAATPNLDKLLAEGALSLKTRVVMPSITQPNWISHLSGSGPEQHGVDNNGWLRDKNHALDAIVTDSDGYYPTVFKVLKDSVPGVKTAFYYNWPELINPYNQRYIDEVSFEDNDDYRENYDKAFKFMMSNRENPTLVFLYSVHTDHAGHKSKWMSPEYISSIEEADVNIGKLLGRMREEGIYDDTHIMFITDHGGINYGHGGMTPDEMIVPWGIKGKGIRSNFVIEDANNTVNTAPTVLYLFGVDRPSFWTGEVAQSIFK